MKRENKRFIFAVKTLGKVSRINDQLLTALKSIPTECDHKNPHLYACWVCKVKEAIRIAEE